MLISNMYRKLGHISCLVIKHTVTKGLIEWIDLDLNSKPDAKLVHQPFLKESKTRAEKFSEWVHWDLWGPASVKSLNGNHYVAACINDATRQTKLYFQSKKSQTFDSYKKDEAYIETQMGNCIKTSCANWGREFMLKELINHQDQKDTKHEFMVYDSPPQNGVSECSIRMQAEWACALLLASGLSCLLWEEAMKHLAWLQDQTPACALNGKTPHEMGNKEKPNLAGIKEFGAAVYIKDLTAGKLDAWAKKGCFVGYNSESKGHQIYWPEKWSITIERNIVFNQDDATTHNNTAIIYGKVLSEGEKEKVIQNPQNNATNIEQLANEDSEDQQAPEKESEPHQSPKSTNSICFPMSEEPQNDPDPEPQDTSQPLNQQYGCGQWVRPERGHYKAMNKGASSCHHNHCRRSSRGRWCWRPSSYTCPG